MNSLSADQPMQSHHQPQEAFVDLHLATPERGFGCMGLQRSIPALLADSAEGASEYPDIYDEARTLAERMGITSVIAVGCGQDSGHILRAFADTRFTITAIDAPGPAMGHRWSADAPTDGVQQPIVRRERVHLSSKHHLEETFDALVRAGPHIVIVAHVLEGLTDPRNLLYSLRGLLLQHADSRILVVTPDRERTHGVGYTAIPTDPCVVREWTSAELSRFLVSCGFTVETTMYTRADTADAMQRACAIELSCAVEAYDAFLLRSGIGHTHAAYAALLTAEHATLATTGGIGTYASYAARLDEQGIITVYVGDADEANLVNILTSGWIHPSLFFERQVVASWPRIEQAWKTTEQLLFYFHHIQVIEYQDYQGLGARVAQAKRSGLVSRSICVQVMCHGNQAHVENANEAWGGLAVAESWMTERVAIEQADRVVIPTDHLEALYREIGYDLGDRILRQRLPYFYTETDPFTTSQLAQIDTLIFFGKLSPLKGIAHFIEAIGLLEAVGRLDQIKHLICVGPRHQIEPQHEHALAALAERYQVTYLEGRRTEILTSIQARRARSLVVMPYLGDNHPYSVLEMIDLGVPFVSYQRGGIPTLIPPRYQANLLALPTPPALARQIEQLLHMFPDERQRLFHDLRRTCVGQQEEINRTCLQKQLHRPLAGDLLVEVAKQTNTLEPDDSLSGDLATVIVPVYNTKRAYIRDLCYGLNAQSVQPHKVIFIDDGSQPGYVEDLSTVLADALRLPWQLITQPHGGVAATLNAGLKACSTKYLVVIGSDDVPTHDFLFDYLQHMSLDADLWATSSYVQYFEDEQDWRVARPGGEWYRPLGVTAIVYGQISNMFGSASAIYHVERLRTISGWDASDLSMWEDWACYLNIASHHGKLGIIPKLGLLYRVHSDSISRTYQAYPAMRRLARNTTALPRWEAFSLHSIVRAYELQTRGVRQLDVRDHERLQQIAAQEQALAEQSAMLAELRQWGADQSALIAAQEQALAEQALAEQALAEQALAEQALAEQALAEQALAEQTLLLSQPRYRYRVAQAIMSAWQAPQHVWVKLTALTRGRRQSR